MAPVVGLAPTRTGLKDQALGSLHSRALALEKWRNAEGMLLITLSRDEFVSSESRLACPVHVPFEVLVLPAGISPATSAFEARRSGH